MSISSISFWQQDQNWLQQQQGWDQQLNGSNAAISAMTSALTNKSSGLASLANQEALTRVTNQLQAAATAALKGGSSASVPVSTSSGILNNYSPALQSSGTAASVLGNFISNESASSGLAGLINGSLVNVVA